MSFRHTAEVLASDVMIITTGSAGLLTAPDPFIDASTDHNDVPQTSVIKADGTQCSAYMAIDCKITSGAAGRYDHIAAVWVCHA